MPPAFASWRRDVRVLRITEPIEVVDGNKSIRITPSNRLVIKYKIDFAHPTIGKQALQFDLQHDNFLKKIAPARTFGFKHEVEKLRAAGLARGGSVENCIVLDDGGVMNGPLRFRDEFVRHKILDLVGDLALIGRPVVGEITAYKAGHALHSQVRRADSSGCRSRGRRAGDGGARHRELRVSGNIRGRSGVVW